MKTEILKTVATLLFGGLAGTLLNEWFRRRSAKLQMIPLIERVNRLVSPELKGFTLARVTDEHHQRHLEEIENVREYQLTLRNTSTVHLQDSEIQFDFPTADVEAWTSRPALSRTPLVLVDAMNTELRSKSFRWRIPQLPSADSIEFSFTAVNPPSSEYEVSLHKTGHVIVKKSKGEPSAQELRRYDGLPRGLSWVIWALCALLILFAAFLPSAPPPRSIREFGAGNCKFAVVSSYDRSAREWPEFPWDSDTNTLWQVSYRLINIGDQTCVVESDELTGGAVTISRGQESKRTAYSVSTPTLIMRELFVGTDKPSQKAQVEFYAYTKTP